MYRRVVRGLGMIALICAFMLTACGNTQNTALRFGLASAPVTLDPRFATDATSARINRLLYVQLVAFDEHAQPVPGLAHWKKVIATHYRFVLGDQGRTFHDGSRLTAADVKATYDFILNPDHASPHRSSLDMIERIVAPDSETIDFYLSKPDPIFPGRLVIGIVPARLIAANHGFNRHPIGSGPFEFQSWPEDGRLILVRRADKQRLEFLHVPDPTVRLLKLMRGEIDMAQNDLPPELVAYAEQRPELQVMKGKGSNFTYLGFNMNDPVTGCYEVRRAIAQALDRPAIIKHVLGGAARPASALLPPDHWAGNPALPSYDYDPAQARTWLAKGGYDAAHPASIVYKTSSDPFRIRLATIIQQQLAEVGVNVELRSYDWGTFYGDIKAGRFQMFSLSWVGIKTPDIFHYAFHSTAAPPAGANRGRYASPVADRMIEQAEAQEDLAMQAKYYRELQAYLLEQLPYVPLWYEDHVFVARKDIQGYKIAADGNYDGLMHVVRNR